MLSMFGTQHDTSWGKHVLNEWWGSPGCHCTQLANAKGAKDNTKRGSSGPMKLILKAQLTISEASVIVPMAHLNTRKTQLVLPTAQLVIPSAQFIFQRGIDNSKIMSDRLGLLG